MKKLLSLFLVLALAFSLCVGVLAEEPAGELAGEIVILHTNDVHGAISSYAKVAALKADYEAKGAEVLLMDAGDYIQGEPYVSVSQGETAIRLMNYVGYDVATIGNHEFDYGYENLAKLAAAAEFPIIAANVMYNGKTAFEANKVFELESGVKVGVFGLSTPETATKAHPGKIKGVTFLSGDDMNKAAQAQVDELTAAGCDYIICLGHLGIDDSSKGYRSVDLLEAVTGIDVFIDGHSHSSLDDVKALVGEDCKVGDTLLTSTGTKLATVGAVVISEDGISIESVDLEKYEGSDDVVEEAAQLVIDEVDAAYGEVFAKSEVELCGEKAPGNRTDITKKDVNTVLPFGNTVAYVTVKGSVLLEALEASTYCTPEAVGAFPQVAGINFTVDTNKVFDQGEQYPGSTYYAPASINRVTIESINGKAFDPEATYVVVTNDFLAAGGDTYYAFSVSTSVDTGIPMDEAVMSYITEELKGVVTAEKYGEPQGRITVLEPVFTDVVEGKWYYDAVMTAYEKELMNGVTANTFEPLTAMNRAMLVTMLYRLEGSPAVEGNVSETFTDCKDTAYYANAVLWAFQNEIVTGRGETTFAPLSNLTRQEMAVILYNYMKYKGADEVTEPELSYSDADKVASWATAAVAYCTQTELMNGVTAETFDPAGSANRAMGATVLVRIAEAA